MKIHKSIWKYPYNQIKLSYFKKDKESSYLQVYNRNLTLTTRMLDKKIKCHKGKAIGQLLVEKQHLGHKLGEFFITKILGERIAYRKKQKLLLKRSKSRQKQKKK